MHKAIKFVLSAAAGVIAAKILEKPIDKAIKVGKDVLGIGKQLPADETSGKEETK